MKSRKAPRRFRKAPSSLRQRIPEARNDGILWELFPVALAMVIAVFVAFRSIGVPDRWHSAPGTRPLWMQEGCPAIAPAHRGNLRRSERLLQRAMDQHEQAEGEEQQACSEDEEVPACVRARRALRRANEVLDAASGDFWATRVMACL